MRVNGTSRLRQPCEILQKIAEAAYRKPGRSVDYRVEHETVVIRNISRRPGLGSASSATLRRMRDAETRDSFLEFAEEAERLLVERGSA